MKSGKRQSGPTVAQAQGKERSVRSAPGGKKHARLPDSAAKANCGKATALSAEIGRWALRVGERVGLIQGESE